MLRIVGDINLTDGYFDVGFGIGTKLSKGLDPFCNLERTREDCWIGNFEGVASEVTDKACNAAFQFRVSPSHIGLFKHFDVYGCANNHAMQHGAQAYNDTLDALHSNGAMTFGSMAQKTLLFEHQGRRVSVTGFSQRIDYFSECPSYWHNPDNIDIQKEIEQIPEDAYKIVYIHWGNEFINRPSVQQKRFAHWLIDIGFDLVVGHHPHVMQGYETYHGKYIYYSLGNFVFDMPWEPTKYGAIVNVDLSSDNVEPTFDYIRINEDYIPYIINSEDLPLKYSFKYLNTLLSEDDNSEEYHQKINKCYREYRKANHKDIFMKMLHHPEMILGTLKDYINRRF